MTRWVGGRGRNRGEMNLTGPCPKERLSQAERNVGIPPDSLGGVLHPAWAWSFARLCWQQSYEETAVQMSSRS